MESGPSPVIISEALAKFLGTGGREMLQAEATKRVWEYIKVNHLEVGCWCTSLFYFFYLNLFIYIIWAAEIHLSKLWCVSVCSFLSLICLSVLFPSTNLIFPLVP